MSLFSSYPLKSAMLCVAGCLASLTPSLAEEPDANAIRNFLAVPEVRAAISVCAADVSKFCAKVKPGEGRIVRCLMTNATAVEPACMASMASAKAALGK
jgi:Cysteine rich repeat